MFNPSQGEAAPGRLCMRDIPWCGAGSALSLLLALTGCGAEVAVGAAATGSLQAEQAKDEAGRLRDEAQRALDRAESASRQAEQHENSASRSAGEAESAASQAQAALSRAMSML